MMHDRGGTRHLLAGMTLVLSVSTALPVRAEGDPQDWLVRMGQALGSLNYEGTLVQMHGNEASVMHVVHRVDGGVGAERITAMNEVGREIIRRGDEVTCIFPDQRTVVVGRRSSKTNGTSPLRQQFPDDARFDDEYYRFAIASGGRLVGRSTWLVTVKPMDQYRYGYQLWLDRETAIPLKVQIHASDGSVVEQLLFSEISLAAQIPATALNPSVSTEGFSWRQSDAGGSEAPAVQGRPASPVWRATSLPPGFRLHTARSRRLDSGDEPMEHLVYTDGLVNVSVFVESGVNATGQGEGVSRIGAANAYTEMTGTWLVTAVGEVPVRTVEMIARSLQRTDGDPMAGEIGN